MHSAFSNLKLKINANLETFKSPRSSPIRTPRTPMTPTTPHPPMLSEISKSASLNYPNQQHHNNNTNNNNNNNKQNLSLSVTSPVSPAGRHTLMDDEYIAIDNSPAYDCKQVLLDNGYDITSKIATTLQGEVFKANHISDSGNNKSVVVKVTDKELHNKGIAVVDGKEISIQENIVNEIRILKWLSRHHPPPHMTRFVDFFQDEKNIFLVMADGGMDFFKFVAECHKLINNKLLSISEWQCAIKVLFKQMVIFVDWLHNKMNICHLDISLENLLINNVFVMSDHSQTGQSQIYFSHNFYIKFCDFGLAEAFDGKDFRCNKYVGKTGYKAPKVYGKKRIFDARAADIWSLGVVFFMMAIGAPPFKRPCKKECGFNLIINGQLDELLKSWNRLSYLTPQMYHLLASMLTKEDKRITIQQIKRHPWLQ